MNEYRSASFPVGQRHAIRVYQNVDDAGVLADVHLDWTGGTDGKLIELFMPALSKAQALAARWGKDSGKQLDGGGNKE